MEWFSLLQAVEREWWQNWGMFYNTLTTTSTSQKLEVQLGTSIITIILFEGQMDEMRLLLANLRVVPQISVVVPSVVSIQGQHLLATVSMAHSMVADIARF